MVSRSRQPLRASSAWFKLEVEEACAGSGGPSPPLSGRTLIGLAEVPGPPVDQSQCRKDWRAVWVGKKQGGVGTGGRWAGTVDQPQRTLGAGTLKDRRKPPCRKGSGCWPCEGLPGGGHMRRVPSVRWESLSFPWTVEDTSGGTLCGSCGLPVVTRLVGCWAGGLLGWWAVNQRPQSQDSPAGVVSLWRQGHGRGSRVQWSRVSRCCCLDVAVRPQPWHMLPSWGHVFPPPPPIPRGQTWGLPGASRGGPRPQSPGALPILCLSSSARPGASPARCCPQIVLASQLPTQGSLIPERWHATLCVSSRRAHLPSCRWAGEHLCACRLACAPAPCVLREGRTPAPGSSAPSAA